jgi:hypothetical protein
MRGQLSHGATGQRSSTVIHILFSLFGETMTQLHYAFNRTTNVELYQKAEKNIMFTE